MKSTFVLIRHAHRDTTHREENNGLSGKGEKQANQISDYFHSRFKKDEGVFLYSSPKRRCTETLKPLSTSASFEIEIDEDLDEQRSGETDAEFKRRLVKWWNAHSEKENSLQILCSHGDVIPVLMEAVFGIGIACKKGSWIECENKNSTWSVTRVIQSFEEFSF